MLALTPAPTPEEKLKWLRPNQAAPGTPILAPQPCNKTPR